MIEYGVKIFARSGLGFDPRGACRVRFHLGKTSGQ